MPMQRKELENHFNALFVNSETMKKDFCPNGLQIEGGTEIKKIGFAVSATEDVIDEAIQLKVDALVTHHGLFWNYMSGTTMTGVIGRKVRKLIKHDINLISYHLPLDAHPVIGNAAILAKLIDVSECSPFGDHKGLPTGVKGSFSRAISVNQLKAKLEEVLCHPVILSTPDDTAMIKSVGVITGGASNGWRLACSAGLDAYITGEVSEHDWSDSKEHGMHFFAGGHIATEVFGVKELYRSVNDTFSDVQCVFIDSKNPV